MVSIAAAPQSTTETAPQSTTGTTPQSTTETTPQSTTGGGRGDRLPVNDCAAKPRDGDHRRATQHGFDFAEAVLDVVAQIPPGRVMTYGGVAAVLGSRASRRVGQVMARRGGEVPWWRVVHADGRPADGHEAAALAHYRKEGTPLRETADGYRIRLAVALWRA